MLLGWGYLSAIQRPTREGDINHSLANISLAQRALGYHLEVDFFWQLQQMAMVSSGLSIEFRVDD